MSNEIKIFSPATVANVACGFDVLGFCLDTIGDDMVIRKTEEKGIRITKIEGYDLPYEVEKNVAGVSALAMYNDLKPDCGFEIEIYKNIKPGSGIGSSSASAAGSVFGMNELLGRPLDKTKLTYYAMKGEALASQCEHADNLAPAIFGGFTLVKSTFPLQVLELPTPSDLFATLIHPQIEIKTADSRAILPKEIPLQHAITQWANVGTGLPVIDTLSHLIASGDKVNTIQAVLSGSLNFIFNNFNAETTFYDVVKQAQDEGYTEPDPRIDLSGIDVARKVLILARESGHQIELSDLETENFLTENAMKSDTVEDFYKTLSEDEAYYQSLYKSAQEKNCQLKFVAEFDNGKAKVGLQEIPEGHPFYNLKGKDNIVMFYTQRYPEQPMIIKGAGAGADVTASGLFADIIRIANN